MNDDLINKISEVLDDLSKQDDNISNKDIIKKLKDNVDILAKEFDKPIMQIKCSRVSTKIECKECTVEEIEKACVNVIGHVLNLIPEQDRNEIIYKAIQIPKSEKGELLEDDN